MQRVRRSLSMFAAAAVLCAAPSGRASGPRITTAPGDVPHAVAEKIRVRGVANFGEVTPGLYRGAQPTRAGFESLHRMGIDIVVDLRGGSEAKREEKEVTAAGMKFVSIPWECSNPKDGYFAKFLALIQDNPGKKIFVHCHVGVDRTGMMIASYRMAEQGWTADEALHEMKAFGFSTFHQMICYGLGSYEHRFPTVVSSSPAFQTLRAAQNKPAVPMPAKQ